MLIRQRARITIAPDFKNAGGIHPYHEILYISSGEGTLHWLGQAYPAQSGCLFLLTPNTPHHLVVNNNPCRIWYIEYDLQNTAPCLSDRETILWNRLQGSSENGSIYDQPIQTAIGLLDSSFLLDECAQSMRNVHNEIVQLTIQQLLLLVHCFLDNRRAELSDTMPDIRRFPIETASTQQIIHRVMRTIESGYKRNLSLEGLSARAHLNPSYLVRLYREQTGSTPLKYLHELRMTAAKCYLTETDMTIQEIADAIGYRSIHYFSRMFKQHFHVAPSEWRKKGIPERKYNEE